MVCKNPYQQGNMLHDCGACLPCRIKRRRTWTNRILLEARQYADNAFITLTYSEETLPTSGSLIPEHLTLWLKRLRKAIEPARVRYYAVGEYGTVSQRPHYHIAMFGYPNCLRGQSRLGLKERMVNADFKCCVHCDLIYTTWQKGGVFVGALEAKSAQYVAQYVMKKMTNHQDQRLNGRWPEFAVMSRRPGIGVTAMDDVADVLMRFNLDERMADVPSVIQHGSKQLPLGRFLRRKLRQRIGRSANAPPEVTFESQKEMLVMLQNSIDLKEAKSVKKLAIERDQGKIAKIEVREQIMQQRKKL